MQRGEETFTATWLCPTPRDRARMLDMEQRLAPVAAMVRSSHERWDGRGYPDRLSGETIPLGARIVAVCDAFDAMTKDRSYRPGMTPEAALTELHRCAGSQFDPAVVTAFEAALSVQPVATSRAA